MMHFLIRSVSSIGATVLLTDDSMSEHDRLRRRYFSIPENIWRFLDVILATGILVILAQFLVSIDWVLRWRDPLGEILDEIPRKPTLDRVLEVMA